MPQFFKFPPFISENAKILVAPLDWGLGHATRCLPLISRLILENNARITVAASGAQRALIEESFPDLPFLTPPSNNLKYHKNRAGTITGLIFSLPGILRIIRKEALWLEQVLARQPFDAIISDNRYGLSSSVVPSFLLTHQLLVKTPFGEPVNRLVQKQLYKWVNRFTECWIPDYEKEPGLAGELSHPVSMPEIPVRWLGPISRLEPKESTGHTDLLVILSGPEPQRSILEKKVLDQWPSVLGKNMVMVRGLPLDLHPPPIVPNARIYNHLPGSLLAQEVANAAQILCRSGYSSIMDLLPLGKNCCMVATPGQSEQEYLAEFLAKQGRIRKMDQKNLRISALF